MELPNQPTVGWLGNSKLPTVEGDTPCQGSDAQSTERGRTAGEHMDDATVYLSSHEGVIIEPPQVVGPYLSARVGGMRLLAT